LDFLYKYIERAWVEKELMKRDPERIFLGVMTQQPIDRLMWTVVETFRDRFVSQSRTGAEWESFVRNDLQLNESMTDIFNVYKKYDDVNDRAKRRKDAVHGFEHIHLSSLSLDLADKTPSESALDFLRISAASTAASVGTKVADLPMNMKQLLNLSSLDDVIHDLDTILASFVYMSYGRFPRFITLMSMKKPSSSAEIQASEVSYLAEAFGFPCSYDHNLDGRSPAWDHKSETTYVKNLKKLQSIDSENRAQVPIILPFGMKQLRILNRDIAIGNVQMHTVDISSEEKMMEESSTGSNAASGSSAQAAEFGSIFELYKHIKNVNKWNTLSGDKVAKRSLYIQYRKHNSEKFKWETGRLSFMDPDFKGERVTLTLYPTFTSGVGQDLEPLFQVKSSPYISKAERDKKFAKIFADLGLDLDSKPEADKDIKDDPDADKDIDTVFEEDEAVDQFTAFRQVPVDEMLELLDSEVKTVIGKKLDSF